MDIFDTFASYKPYNIFVVRWPSMPLNNYLEKIDNLVEATFWCTDEKIFDLVKSNNKIYITNEEVNKKVKEKYNKQPILFGVTGSFGKTSVSWYLYQLLKQRHTVFLSSSLGIGDDILRKNTFTTPTFIDLKRELYYTNAQYAVIESSSQGITQGRLGDLTFMAGIFTGFQVDHLEFHKTIENYLEAKLSFFLNYKPKYMVAQRLVPIPEIMKRNFVLYPSEKYIINDGISIREKCNYETNLHNIHKENLLGAIALLNECNIEFNDLNILPPKGRLSLIGKNKFGANVYVDGAHTPQQVEMILKYTKNPFVVIGVNGKRFITDIKVGEVVAKYGKGIITDDGPENLDNEFINSSLIRNTVIELSNSKDKLINIQNRFHAIKIALEQNVENILILGKSTEVDTNVNYKGFSIYYDEIKVVEILLQRQLNELIP